MYILILIFPLIGFLLPGAFGRYFGREGSAYLSTLSLFLTLILSIIFFYEICLCKSVINIKLYS
jgi:NADH:ubiquinone oxidoreductase subunit 5 (subunit L)/multisubunit Na+/H+ antiporter MnhA subunit